MPRKFLPNLLSGGGAEPTVERAKLATLWATEYSRFKSNRERVEYVGQWRRREIRPHIPQGWENPEAFEVVLPHATTIPLDVLNFLGRKRPAGRRTPLGEGPTAGRLASQIEEFVQEAMDHKLRANGEDLWESLLAHSSDGEFAVLVLPRPAHWDGLLDFTEKDDEGNDVDDGAGNPRIAPAFRRDARGLSEGEFEAQHPRASFKLDRKKSAAAYAAYARDAKAQALPVVVRILPPSMYLPVSVDSATGRVDALLIKSSRTVLSLKRDGFNFTLVGSEVPGTSNTTVSQALAGSGTTLTLYELFVPGKVLYELEGPGNQRLDATFNGQTAMVDLEADFGISEVPGGVFFGPHHPQETDLAKKGFPFLEPFIGLIRGGSQTITAKIAHAFRFAFYGPAIKLDKELLGAWKEMGHPATFELKPMKMNLVPGEVQQIQTPSVGKDADEVIQLTLGTVERLSPTGAMQGGSGDSGFAQGVSLASTDHMLRQITEGARQGWRCVAENTLMIVAAISRKTGASVPVYVTVRPGKGGRTEDRPQVTRLLEVSADDLQGNYTIQAILPQPKFQNLALMQAGIGFVESGHLSETTWMQDMGGIEQPEEEQDRIWVEAQLKSPEGQQYVLGLAARKQGNAELTKLAKLQSEGKAGPGGVPTDAMPPRPGAPSSTGEDLNGPNSGNPAASALGGIVAAASQTAPQARVIAATGQPAPVAA